MPISNAYVVGKNRRVAGKSSYESDHRTPIENLASSLSKTYPNVFAKKVVEYSFFYHKECVEKIFGFTDFHPKCAECGGGSIFQTPNQK